MTIDIKIPSGSDKKFFEMADETYERRKASNIFNFAERLDEARLVHKAEGRDGVVAHVYHDQEVEGYGVKLKKDGKMLPGGTPYHYEDEDKESAISTAKHMANNYKMQESVEDIQEARLVHKAEGKNGVVAHVYKDEDSYGYAVKLKLNGKMLPGGTPNHYEDDDKESAIATATHMANNYKLDEAYSVPTGLSGNLATMFGVHTQPVAHAKPRDKNDKVDPETQEPAMVADPHDLAVKIHAALPGMTRKAISVDHILSALQSGITAPDVNRLSQSAVGRKRLRSCCEGVDDVVSSLVEKAADEWTVEFNSQKDGCVKYTIRDGDDVLAEGVNFTQSAAMLMASRDVDALKASIEESVLQLKEEADNKKGQASRVLGIAKSMAHK